MLQCVTPGDGIIGGKVFCGLQYELGAEQISKQCRECRDDEDVNMSIKHKYIEYPYLRRSET